MMIKKLLLLMIASMLIFTGCKKDDDTLKGTTWEIVLPHLTDDSETLTFKFSENKFDMTYVFVSGKASITENSSGTYTYKHPKVMMTVEGETIEGTIDGNSMTINFNGQRVILKKK